jgi:hypothetical protein
MGTECVYCEIMAGRAPADVVYEDELTVASIDPRQHNPGHVLVVPRAHINDVRHLVCGTRWARPPFRKCPICTCTCIRGGSATVCCGCTLVHPLMRIRSLVRRTRSACGTHLPTSRLNLAASIAHGSACNAPNVPGEVAFCSSTPGTLGATPLVTVCLGPVPTTMSGLPSPFTSATAISLAFGVA